MTDVAPDIPDTPAETGEDDTNPEDVPKGSERAVLADLARERDKRQAAEAEVKKLRKAEQELSKLREAHATAEEKAPAAAKAEGRTEALTVANARLVKAEIKAAAAGALQDPDDAIAYIDASAFEVDDDGNVDTKAIKAEVDRLVKAKPYLAAGVKPAALPGGGAMPSQGSSMDDLIRKAARGKGL